MKVYLSDTGDRSVGIPETEVILEINWELPTTEKEREGMRKDFIQMARDYLQIDGRVFCHFEDECPTCYSKLKDNKCTYKGCIEFRDEFEVKIK
jgi:hypothetical protein